MTLSELGLDGALEMSVGASASDWKTNTILSLMHYTAQNSKIEN